MARGWESKSVESQLQDTAIHLKNLHGKKQAPLLSAEARQQLSHQHCLELSRTRVLREIQTCTTERFRVQLEHELAFLDAELHKIVH